MDQHRFTGTNRCRMVVGDSYVAYIDNSGVKGLPYGVGAEVLRLAARVQELEPAVAQERTRLRPLLQDCLEAFRRIGEGQGDLAVRIERELGREG